MATVLSASAFNIHTIIYYHRLDFLIKGPEWSSDAVTAVFGMPALISALAGALILMYYRFTSSDIGRMRIFLAWMILLCCIHVFGDLMAGAVFNKGSGYVLMYWFFRDTGRLAITLTSAVILIIMGRGLCRMLFFTAYPDFNRLSGDQKIRFAWFQFIFPFVCGSAILQIADLPDFNLFSTCVRWTGLLVLIPFLLGCRGSQDLYFDDEERKPVLAMKPASIAAGLLIVCRLVMEVGIRM